MKGTCELIVTARRPCVSVLSGGAGHLMEPAQHTNGQNETSARKWRQGSQCWFLRLLFFVFEEGGNDTTENREAFTTHTNYCQIRRGQGVCALCRINSGGCAPMPPPPYTHMLVCTYTSHQAAQLDVVLTDVHIRSGSLLTGYTQTFWLLRYKSIR